LSLQGFCTEQEAIEQDVKKIKNKIGYYVAMFPKLSIFAPVFSEETVTTK
jgi:hypothetical protein